MNDTALAPTPSSPTPPAADRPAHRPSDSPSPRVRLAWLVIGSLFAAGLLVFGTFSVVDALAHERTTEVTTHEGVTALLIEGDGGSVVVRSDDVADVTVTARVSEGLRSTGLTRVLEGDRLVLRSTCPKVGGTWCAVDWDVVVPVGIDVTLRSEDGRADVTGEFGAVDLRSEDDGVTFDGVARSVIADSEDGNVTIRLADAPDSVRAVSEDGNVNVVVPDIDDGYRVEVSSEDGSTEIGVRTDPNAVRTIEARTEDGNVAVVATP